jgi:hypothetical protein
VTGGWLGCHCIGGGGGDSRNGGGVCHFTGGAAEGGSIRMGEGCVILDGGAGVPPGHRLPPTVPGTTLDARRTTHNARGGARGGHRS